MDVLLVKMFSSLVADQASLLLLDVVQADVGTVWYQGKMLVSGHHGAWEGVGTASDWLLATEKHSVLLHFKLRASQIVFGSVS